MYENHPSILDRLKSSLIDAIILIACMMLFSDILNNFTDVPVWVRVALFASLLMYEPICTAFGATLGNHRMQIRVRRNSDESKRINFFQAIIRYVFKLSLGWLSFISVFVNPKGRTIHDLICGSVMVKVEK